MTRREVLGAAAAAGGLLAGAPAGAAEKTLAERLGFKKDDRLLLVHADDIGMCHSVNVASGKAMTEGSVSCGSAMAPCPWFPALCSWAKEHPEVDMGLHLTLTSEWRHYRWRPLSPPDKVKGLLDGDGFMWRSVEDVVKHATPDEVALEIAAQIERARHFGLKLTHIDSHMGTLFSHAGFFEAYLKAAKQFDLMPMLPAPTFEIVLQARAMGLDYVPLVDKLKGQGYVFLDRLVLSLTGDTYEDRRKSWDAFLAGLKPGVTELICHLAGNEDEIRNITGNWEKRYWEFRLFTDPAVKRGLEEAGIKLIGYRQLSTLWGKPAA